MSRWLIGLVVLAACTSRPAPVAPTTAATPPPTTATVTQVKPGTPADDLAVAAAAYERGNKANVAWKFDDATRELEVAFRIYEAKVADTDERFLDTLEELARATRGAGDWGRSTQMIQRWLEIVRSTGDKFAEARATNQLGLTVDQSGDPRGGKKLFEAALALDDELGLPDNDDEKNAHLHNLALVLSDLNEYKRAAKMFERVLAVDRAADPVSVSTANTMHNLALTYRDDGEYTKAKSLFESAIRILNVKAGPTHPRIIPSLNGLAGTLLLMREYDEAELLYNQVLAIPNLSIQSRSVALADLAALKTETNRPDEAVVHLDESLELLQMHFANPKGHAEIIRTLIKRTEAHVALKNYPLAIRDTDAAIAMSEKINAGDKALVAHTIDSFVRIWTDVPSEAKRAKALKARARAVRAGA